MFGSKIRSWMENHIVRPRKKGNKNKNGTSNLVSSNGTTQNGHKGTTTGVVSMYHQGHDIITQTTTIQGAPIASSATATNSSTISSPARRSEVSPIQSHNQSRFGWQSPQNETAMSPKSDHFIFQHKIKSHTLSSTASLQAKQQISAKTATSQISSVAKTKTLSPNNMPRRSSYYSCESSASNHLHVTSSSSSSNNHNPNSGNQNVSRNNKNIQEHHQPVASNQQALASVSAFQQNHANKNDNCFKKITNNNDYNNAESNNGNLRKNCLSNQQNDVVSVSRQQIDQQNSITAGQYKQDESRYGRILQSKNVTSVESFAPSLRSYDNLNANIHFQGSGTSVDGKHHCHHINPNNNNIQGNNGIGNVANYHYPPLHHTHQYQHNGHGIPARACNENNRNTMRTNRFNNSGMLGPANNHPIAGVINTLSSPESAYSTGYSTDGTSPGATYTPPEYYINMRTGTHYFPKGVNSLAIEANRYKFGLNKIEEMSPQDPLPNSHRRTESFDLGQNKIPDFGIPDLHFFGSTKKPHQQQQCQTSSPIPQRNIALQSYKGFESPSPRQRSRIRTNPWYSTTETSSSGNSSFLPKKIEMDAASSSSSGIKSSSDAGASDKNEKKDKSSESDSTSSSTEVEVSKKTFSPGTIRRKKFAETATGKTDDGARTTAHPESDEDATLNEMMGKFDESYVYEKETDILSDSDPTDCASELDTGQDAGDECDTDELLDIDFIDNGSIQEIVEKKEVYKNTGSCSYFNYQIEKRASRLRKGRKQNDEVYCSKRKKRLLKTRKKGAESRDREHSPVRNIRGSRSLGGTPVSLRRNQSADSKKSPKMSPLTNRSNSLTFTEVHTIRSRVLAIAESEKVLLKADLEADVKYKQLIHEAETILVSMKTLRETPVASPRRICNVPTNKRVEMLRNCEADLKRELIKHQKSLEDTLIAHNSESLINKRLEILKQELSSSAPNSPKCGRFSPRKTHVTNFINQNVPPIELQRRNSVSDAVTPPIKSPQLQLNGRGLKSPPTSPALTRRRFRSQSPRVTLYSDTDSDEDNSKKSARSNLRRHTKSCTTEYEMNGNRKKNDFNEKTNTKSSQKIRDLSDDYNNRNIVMDIEKLSVYDANDYENQNITENQKPPLMSFRSIDMGNKTSANFYVPQSEPLKRKIYSGSSTFERIKKTLDLDSEIPKRAILEKISNLRRERQALKNSGDMNRSQNSVTEGINEDDRSTSSNISSKHQLIFNTIEDLKRSLEDQSVELCGLNGDDDNNEIL